MNAGFVYDSSETVWHASNSVKRYGLRGNQQPDMNQHAIKVTVDPRQNCSAGSQDQRDLVFAEQLGTLSLCQTMSRP